MITYMSGTHRREKSVKTHGHTLLPSFRASDSLCFLRDSDLRDLSRVSGFTEALHLRQSILHSVLLLFSYLLCCWKRSTGRLIRCSSLGTVSASVGNEEVGGGAELESFLKIGGNLMTIPWLGLSCCVGAAALYLLGWNSGRDAEVIRSVPRVNQLKDLAQLLDIESKVVPLVVSISGKVGSETPISCEYSRLTGVIVEKRAEQHFLKQNDAGSWIQDSASMPSMRKEVPWYLEDGTGRVYVKGARNASGFELTVQSEVFDASPRSLVLGTLDYLQGLKMIGVKHIEQVLPVGTSLTVVGEVVKDDMGTIHVERPDRGPFYVTPMTLDQLIVNLGKWARWYKYASVGLSAVVIFMIAKHAIQYFMVRRRHWELRRRVLEAAAKRSGQNGQGSDGKAEEASGDGNRDPHISDLCVICLEHEYDTVFVPCGHMCCCMTCSSRLTNCPLCRRRIEQALRTFRT